MITESEFERLKSEYNRLNDTFCDIVCFHVGCVAGFHSEVDAMMQCMLWCFSRRIRFVLYADDANFAGGNGWSEFFMPFCELNHSTLNKSFNRRNKLSISAIIRKPFLIFEPIVRIYMKKKYGIKYLTQDVFDKAIDRRVSQTEVVLWDLFSINGCTLDEFGKISCLAMRYNRITLEEMNIRIESIHLPKIFYSTQLRGGDKITEVECLHSVEDTIQRIETSDIYNSECRAVFVLSDDYRLIEVMRELRPKWSIYTLTRPDETGYYNFSFQKKSWDEKRNEMIKLFSMVEICLNSICHFGNGQSCLNNYIRSMRLGDGYVDLFNEY